jgi:hypothetical protein
MSNAPADQEKNELIHECSKAYVFNLIYIANQEDKGGFDYPLETKYACLESVVSELLSENIITTESYEEDGESGQELVPSEGADQYLDSLIALSQNYESKDCSGIDRYRRGFYLAMNEGKISRIRESKQKWYLAITSFDFYESLVEAEPPQNMDVNEQDDNSSSTFTSEEVSTPPAAPAIAPPSPKNFRESGESSIDINEFEPEEILPSQTYMYKKPAIIWLMVTGVSLWLGGQSSFMFILSLASAIAAVYFASKKVSISQDGICVSSILGKEHVTLEDIDETLLTEEDDEVKNLKITSSQGKTIEISSWLDDLNGASHLLKNLKQRL